MPIPGLAAALGSPGGRTFKVVQLLLSLLLLGRPAGGAGHNARKLSKQKWRPDARHPFALHGYTSENKQTDKITINQSGPKDKQNDTPVVLR